MILTEKQLKCALRRHIEELEEKTEASRQEIAFRLGVNHITYYGWVSGPKLRSPANLFKLADYFGVKPSDLLH